MSDLRSKAVPSSWAGPLALWSRKLAAAGRSKQTIGLRRAHIAQLSRGVEAGPHELTVDELLDWLADREWARSAGSTWSTPSQRHELLNHDPGPSRRMTFSSRSASSPAGACG